MKTTVSVVCYHHKILTNGESPIMLRICKSGKRTMKSLGISVHTRYWDFTANQPKRNCPNRNYIQQIILRAVSEYNALVLSKEALQEEFTPRTLVHESKEEIRAQSVEEFYVKLIADLKAQGAVGTAYAYQNSYGVLRSFNKGRALTYTFGTIDAMFLEKFEAWMRAKGNKDTTLSFQMRTLRAVFNRAIKAKAVAKEKNPFGEEYKVSKFDTRTPKRALSKEEMMKIVNVNCSAESNLYRLAHDIFVFSYLCGGIAFVDVANLTPDNIVDGRLSYYRQKTHRAINIPLSEHAMQIVERYADYCERAGYLFPILDRRLHITPTQKKNRVHKVCHQVNSELRKLTQNLKISAEITTYVARHSFATVLKKSGVNIGIISESLGHSDLSTTQIYLDSFENSQIDEAMRHLL